jgi:TonB family protein
MGVCLISILLSITPRCGLVPSAASALFQPFVLQIEPTFRGYADSPRPGPVSRMHVTGTVSGKFLIKKVVPEYPADARAAGVEGDVVFAIVLGKNGKVEEIHLRSGNPLLVEAAARAVSQQRYRPYLLDGNPVEAETFATVQFRLPDKHQVNGTEK